MSEVSVSSSLGGLPSPTRVSTAKQSPESDGIAASGGLTSVAPGPKIVVTEGNTVEWTSKSNDGGTAALEEEVSGWATENQDLDSDASGNRVELKD